MKTFYFVRFCFDSSPKVSESCLCEDCLPGLVSSLNNPSAYDAEEIDRPTGCDDCGCGPYDDLTPEGREARLEDDHYDRFYRIDSDREYAEEQEADRRRDDRK